MGVEELFVGGRDKSRMHLHWAKKRISWRNFFLCLDRVTHWFERVHIRPLRSLALRRAEKWMLERFEMSDGLGAIYPSMMNAIIGLRCLGYSVDDPQFIRAMDEFEKLGIEEDDTFRMQPCKSPVWDTAYALLLWARRAFRRPMLGWLSAPSGYYKSKCASLETGRSRIRKASRRLVLRVSTMSSIRMWTTVRWSALG